MRIRRWVVMAGSLHGNVTAGSGRPARHGPAGPGGIIGRPGRRGHDRRATSHEPRETTLSEVPPGGDRPPGLIEQLNATVAAARRLVLAHVELAKTELGAIRDEAVGVAIKASIALSLLLFVGMLLPIGLVLFLGEALFGSIGWGVLHGTELGLSVALALVLSALGLGSGALRGLLGGIVLGVLVGVALGSGWIVQGWETLGERYLTGIVPEWRTTVAALAGGAILVGVVSSIRGLLRGGLGTSVSGLVGGALGGAVLGGLSLVTVDDVRAATGIGVAVALGLWPLISIGALRSLDAGTLRARFYPSATVDTAQETLEWLKRIRG